MIGWFVLDGVRSAPPMTCVLGRSIHRVAMALLYCVSKLICLSLAIWSSADPTRSRGISSGSGPSPVIIILVARAFALVVLPLGFLLARFGA